MTCEPQHRWSAASRLRDDAVHHRVDSADEEAGDAGHLAWRPRRSRRTSRGLDVRLRHFFVPPDAEEQGDVDVDALADQLTNRRDAFDRGAGTLIITLSRLTAFHRRRASSIVAAVSCAIYGETSRLT